MELWLTWTDRLLPFCMARLENVFVASPLVQQIYVHGDSLRSFLVAVVVPNENALRDLISSGEAPAQSLAELCQLDSVKRVILHSLADTISQSGRPAWEAPKVP
jgi:long-subunit acyl-CoA synthetase (AMP-forming)